MPVTKVADKGGNTAVFYDLGCYRLSTFGKDDPNDVQKIFDNLPNFQVRDDDILLSSYPKTGTTWAWELVSMLVQGEATNTTQFKIQYMLEATPEPVIAAQPSPRILNSHLNVPFLPRQWREKRIKTVKIYRNPKDTAVSFYNHTKGFKFYDYDGKFEDYLDWFLEGEVDYGSYADHIIEWEKLRLDDPDFPLHVMFYEDLKNDGRAELKKLAHFLGVSADQALLDAILDKCSFANMSVDKEHSAERKKNEYKPGFSGFRKGEVGDWKNWFTVAQSERFDAVWRQKMRDSNINFKYSN